MWCGMLCFISLCSNIGSHPTVTKQVVHPVVQCKPWEKSARGKCVCKMPFECRCCKESLLSAAPLAASLIGLRLCLSLQIVSEFVRHLRRDREVCAVERVPNARAAVHGQEVQRHWGRRLRMARPRQHHRLHRLPHVGGVRWYGGSGCEKRVTESFFVSSLQLICSFFFLFSYLLRSWNQPVSLRGLCLCVLLERRNTSVRPCGWGRDRREPDHEWMWSGAEALQRGEGVCRRYSALYGLKTQRKSLLSRHSCVAMFTELK